MAQPMLHSEIDAAVDAASERAFEFLEELVRQPSFPGLEHGAEDVFAAELARIGLDGERVPFPDGIELDPAAGIGSPSYRDRSIVVGRLGSGPGALVLNGHLDVVPAGDERMWSSPPFEPSVTDGWMSGRGAGDMKAGLAMGTLAIEALLTADPRAHSIPLAFVGAIEEERSGNGTLASIRGGVTGDAALLLEPTDLRLLVSGVGVLWFEVEVFAAAGHALAAKPAMGALTAALDVIGELRRLEAEFNSPPGAVHHALNIGSLSAGDWQSTVPGAARIGCRIGFPRSMAVAEAMRRVEETVRGAALEMTPAITFNGFRAEGYDLPAGDPLASGVSAGDVSRHRGAPEGAGTAGTTDARFYRNQLGIPALCYGPRVENMHAADERVELGSIVAGARTLARFIRSWGAPP